MKKKPMKKYSKETGRVPIIATMADESRSRRSVWMSTGCNAFQKKSPSSQPMSFWTENDVLEYIHTYNIPYASVYGDIVPCGGGGDNDRRKKNRVCVLRFWRSFGEVSKPFPAAQTVSPKVVGVLHETC